MLLCFGDMLRCVKFVFVNCRFFQVLDFGLRPHSQTGLFFRFSPFQLSFY